MLNEFRSTLITWDKATSRIYSPVTANASDENGRKLVVQIVNGGQVEDLTGATLHLYWETRDKAHDGLDVFDAVDLKKGEFELSYTTGMLSNQGVLNANLVLIDTVGRVVSERFKITVTEGIDDDAIQSENSFTTLTQALIDVSNLEQNYAPRLSTIEQNQVSLEQELAESANYSKDVNSKLNSSRPIQTTYTGSKKAGASVSFIDDDGNRSVLSKLVPISIEKGVPFNVALISSLLESDQLVTNEEALYLQNELGWEVLSHSKNHRGLTEPGTTDEHLDIEVRQSVEELRRYGLDTTNFVYPGGQYDDRVVRSVSKYYNCGVGTGEFINYTPLNTYKLGRIEFPGYAPKNTLAYHKSKVDEAISGNGQLIFMMHCGQSNFDASAETMLRDLVDYILLKNVEILRVQEVLDRHGNFIDFNNQQYYFGADGKNNMVNYIHIPNSPLTGLNQINIDTLPSYFEKDKTYVSAITSATDIQKFPGKVSGILTTVTGTNNTFQRYTENGRKEYIRYANQNDTWTAFKQSLTAEPMKTVTIESFTIPANDFREKSISLGRYSNGMIALVKPRSKMPLGVTFTHYTVGLNGEVYIVFRNNLATAATLNSMEWDCVLLDTFET